MFREGDFLLSVLVSENYSLKLVAAGFLSREETVKRDRLQKKRSASIQAFGKIVECYLGWPCIPP